MTAQLTDVNTGFHIWSESYDREFKDIFEIEEDLARAIVVALQGPLAVAEDELVVDSQTTNVDAYNLLLKGRYYFQSPTQENFDLALAAFQGAIELDPDYWMAHGYLAFSEGYASIYTDFATQVIQTAASTELALRHNPLNVPANLIKGFMGDSLDQAYIYYTRALGEKSDRDLALYVFSNDYLFPQLRQEEAREQLNAALVDDPASILISFNLGMMESRAGNYARALDIISKAGKLDGSNFLVSAVLVDVYFRSGDAEQLKLAAERSIAKIGLQNGFIMQYLLQARFLAGDVAGAEVLLDEMLAVRSAGGFMSATPIAMSLVTLGRIDEAASWFVQANRERDFWLRWHLKSAIKGTPALGENAVVQKLLLDTGLDDASIAARIAVGH